MKIQYLIIFNITCLLDKGQFKIGSFFTYYVKTVDKVIATWYIIITRTVMNNHAIIRGSIWTLKQKNL